MYRKSATMYRHGRLNSGYVIESARKSITVYQRKPDIAISEACVFLQGNHTRSVFLVVFSIFVSFQLTHISASPMIY